RWQMLVTAQRDPYALEGRGGCLLRLSSADLRHWRVEGPALAPGSASVPECPNGFHWNGWYYLLFGLGLQTHYRLSRELWGPWLRPAVDTLDNRALAVLKTAPFGDRRIGAAWVGTRQGDSDEGRLQWGGNIVLREIVQRPDGTLGTRFVPELIPAATPALRLACEPLTAGTTCAPDSFRLDATTALEVAAAAGLPLDYRLRCHVRPCGPCARFGLGLRGSGGMARQIELAFHGHTGMVSLGDQRLEGVAGLDQPFDVEIVAKGDLIDVSLSGGRCLINHLPSLRGDRLFLFAEGGQVAFEEIALEPLRTRS
ncbi:MAG: hypothetical protein V1772_09440, partial [Chloroflexota bacterium]